jgi:hypothetical protein
MSIRFVLVVLAPILLLLGVTRARAELGTIDNTAAATLLLPYFEVDLADANGMTTVFSIVASGQFGTPPDAFGTVASAGVAHVTLWTDLGIPTFAFDIYLTGFDVAPVNLRDVFNGVLPASASDGQDPTDTISPQGDLSQDINFGSCNGKLPYPVPALTAQQITDLRNAHTGNASGLLGGNCGARHLGDGVARGFVTVDDVNACSDLFPPVFPSSPDYFTQVAGKRNLIMGDFMLANPGLNFAEGEALVPIESIGFQGSVYGAGDYTFYGRFVGGAGTDQREPLATRWAAPYEDKPAHSLATELIVWRDPITAVAPFACGGGLPPPYPLGAEELIAFDMMENPEILAPAQPPFPVAAMRTSINGAPPSLAVSPRAGWLYLSLNSPAAVADSPFADKTARQSWVMVLKKAEGRFSSAHAAIQLNNPSTPPPTWTATATVTTTPTDTATVESTPTETPTVDTAATQTAEASASPSEEPSEPPAPAAMATNTAGPMPGVAP